jgi:tetratricopeptide (TPR) repeat protein
VLADALRSLAGLHHLLGDQALADEVGAQGIAVGTESGNLEAVLGCHTVLGLSAQRRHDLDAARSHIQQSRAIAESLGLELDQSVANTNLGEIALEAGDLDEARSRWEQTIEWNHRSGAGDDTFALLGLGEVARRQGLLGESIGHFRAARALAEASGSPHNMVMAMLGEACVAADSGDVESAGELLGYVDAMASTTTGKLHGVDAVTYDDAVRIVEAAVGATRFHELRERGAARLH